MVIFFSYRFLHNTAGGIRESASFSTSIAQPNLFSQQIRIWKSSLYRAVNRKWNLGQLFSSNSCVPLLVSLSGLCIGPQGLSFLSSQDCGKFFIITAKCKSKAAYIRQTDHPNKSKNSKDKNLPAFQWSLFFKLLWKDAIYVIGAILVSSHFFFFFPSF